MKTPLADDVLQQRAIGQLRIALRDPLGELACDWAHRDPDLDSIRDDADPDWRAVTCSYCGGDGRRVRGSPEWKEIVRIAPVLAEGMCELHGIPESPWGAPAAGFGLWIVLAVGAIAALVAGADGWLLFVALALFAAYAFVRAFGCVVAAEREKLLSRLGRASPGSKSPRDPKHP